MIKYLARTIAMWAAMIVVATNVTYFLAVRFLDPVSNYLGRRDGKTLEQQISDAKAKLDGFNLNPDTPVMERWWTWLKGIVLHWDWGKSPTGVPITSEVSYRMWVSAQLVLAGTFLAVIIGVAIGVYTASRQYKLADRVWQGISIITMNIHIVVASYLIVTVAVKFNDWTEATWGTRFFYTTGASTTGVHGFFPVLLDIIRHLTLPTLSLILISYAGYHMTQRTLLLDNISADYVRTARAKGMTRNTAIRKHALRTSIIPVATSVAFSIPAVFTGAIMTETIFAWNGMGRYFIDTLGKNDVHGVVAVAAFGAVTTAIGAVLADMFVVALDPRVRVS
ncbi:MAG: ABC transporter permease [Flaviflexus sp.]|nr:ABC transporter permease [Flaviflexus sp.]